MAPSLDYVFGAVSAGLTLAGDNWKLRGVVELGVEASSLRAGSVKAEISGQL